MKHNFNLICSFFIILILYSFCYSEEKVNNKVYSIQFNSFSGFFNKLGDNSGKEIPMGFKMLAGYNNQRFGMYFNPNCSGYSSVNASYFFDYYLCPYSGRNAEIGIGVTSGYIEIVEHNEYATIQEMLNNLNNNIQGPALGLAFETSFGYKFMRIVIDSRLLIATEAIFQLGFGFGICLISK